MPRGVGQMEDRAFIGALHVACDDSPSVFQVFINDMFCDMLNRLIGVYTDEILICVSLLCARSSPASVRVVEVLTGGCLAPLCVFHLPPEYIQPTVYPAGKACEL